MILFSVRGMFKKFISRFHDDNGLPTEDAEDRAKCRWSAAGS